MASRSRDYNQDWNPMQEDYENSTYDLQYPDDSASGSTQLDHSRLYITNIPKPLNIEGLRAAFSKFGNLIEVHLSADPNKRYGLIGFETANEAKHAMMKLNRTEPLKLNITVAHKKTTRTKQRASREQYNGQRDRNNKEDSISVESRSQHNRRPEEIMNGNNMEELPSDDNFGVTEPMEPELNIEMEQLKLEMKQLKLQEAQLHCKQQMLMLGRSGKKSLTSNTSINRQIYPDGRIVVRNSNERASEPRHLNSTFGAGAGDSNLRCCSRSENKCSWVHAEGSGSTTPSTCVLCSEDVKTNDEAKQRSRDSEKSSKNKSKKSDNSSKYDSRTDTNSKTSKTTTTTKVTDTKLSDSTSKRLDKKLNSHKSELTSDFKCYEYSVLCDSYDEVDETNRLTQLRNADYLDIVADSLKVIIALAGYPKSKMRLRQMETFQRCLTDVIDMQLKAGFLKKVPTFLDYYLNRGAIVCICKDSETRDWIVRVSPGLQERMQVNLILLKSKLKRLCQAVLTIPHTCWPATASDAFQLLRYFNPTLRTETWRIFSQKTVGEAEVTSFIIDRVSAEIMRGPTFKNVIDYNQMEFELTGFTEIYFDSLFSEGDDDLHSVASRVKLLGEIRSEQATPRNDSNVSVSTDLVNKSRPPRVEEPECEEPKEEIEEVKEEEEDIPKPSSYENVKAELKETLPKNFMRVLKDVTYVSEKGEVVVWSDEGNTVSENDAEKLQADHSQAEPFQGNDNAEGDNQSISFSVVAPSEVTESFVESSDNLNVARNSYLAIDSSRGIAYHRRTNYLHVENELKVAITLEGYPVHKLEGPHIRRLKLLFKEYLHKDLKIQRFANLIIPKFQDIYLSNGAVIYICDSLETKDYLTEILPRFVNSTGLKLTFRDIKQLVRYTRTVMRLSKELAHVESAEILMKLQASYPGLKPDCWKYYSDVAGKQKRQFGVDPESLKVIKSPNFDPTYEGEKLSFRIIDRQKRDVSFEEGDRDAGETLCSSEIKKVKDKITKIIYAPIDPELTKTTLTRIRTNHYSDLIADDLKLYVGPSDYPESRIDEVQFMAIERTLHNIVYESLERADSHQAAPKFHDMYLFDGVIFIICQDMASKAWIEQTLPLVNAKLHIRLKATEYRGAVGIISMVVKTTKSTDEVIEELQKQNPRLRTKYWRRISTVHTKTKLDVVLQIDKLSAQIITSPSFNKFIDGSSVQFKLGHLQSLLKPKASFEELMKYHKKKAVKSEHQISKRSKSKVSMQGPKDITFDEIKEDLKAIYPGLKVDQWSVLKEHTKPQHKVCDLEIDETSAKIIEKEDFKLKTASEKKLYFYTGVQEAESAQHKPEHSDLMIPMDDTCSQDCCKMILKIPTNVLPDSKDDLNIVFDLLEDKNPGLNTELWQVYLESEYPNNGKFTLIVDNQSAMVIKGKNFDPVIGGERLKFFF